MPVTKNLVPTLELIAPDTLRFGAERVRVGGATYRGLQRLLGVRLRPDGVRRVRLAAWSRAVWGDTARPVNASTLRGLIFRVNDLLGGMGCPLTVSKVSEDGGEWVALG